MTTSTIKQGQTFLFKGQYAEVVENQPNSQYITIRVGNNVISVNKIDLFGINSNLLSYYDEQIAMYDEQMNKNKETIDINESLWTACKEAIKDGKKMMASILDNLGVQ